MLDVVDKKGALVKKGGGEVGVPTPLNTVIEGNIIDDNDNDKDNNNDNNNNKNNNKNLPHQS